MHKITVGALAIVLAGAWTVVPVIAADETKDKAESKSESTMDKVKEKTVEMKDKLKEKAVEAKDTLKAKTERATDKLAAKTERADVKAAQQALRDRGHDPGPIDGVHGPRTSAALKKFQEAEGLTASGQLDEETMHRLNVPSASPATEPTVPATPAPGAPPVQQRQTR
ncbi:MAG: peptidoglycan-binding protein [Candidatus Rokubacteria bacterium]|nr:peptidoglycan-binding protein [Candidatus Rokubacteria bacterium]